MSNELTFQEWKQLVNDQLLREGITIEIDEDLLFMSFDMENKSVEEAVEEIKQAIADGNL